MKKSILFIICVICLSCNKQQEHLPISNSILTKEYSEKKETIDLKNWHLKDIEIDTLPGISLYRAQDSLLLNLKPKNTVVVAVIDGEIDINHKDLKSKIWLNTKEIVNNGIDDDGNGYIDDVNGWNFTGNLKGENNKFVNLEITRILKKLNPYFAAKDTLNLSNTDAIKFELYKKVKLRFNERLKYFMAEKTNDDLLFELYFGAKNKLKQYFINKPFTVKALDSLKALNIDGITETDFLILTDCIKNNIDDAYVIGEKEHTNNIIDILFDLNFNDRTIQSDDPNNINDTKYGSHIVSNNVIFLNHGTKMAGIISNINLENKIEIMPLPISCYGDEHDKDIALAIRYAVDNGAKVINMSFSKEYSLYKKWVFDAFKYAEKHNVLIVGIAGNFGYNLTLNNFIYPNDNIENDKEVSNNFLMIGASNSMLTSELKSESSSYGNIDVDLFAPGNNIQTLLPKNKYTTSGGTSSAAAITSGVAALIRSYYPKLTASQVKHILMDSGVEYTFNVKVGDTLLPFNTLSKSGKVVNAYNALIMADSISRKR